MFSRTSTGTFGTEIKGTPLWNAAEIAEKRKDARVAREYEVALPHELKADKRVELVRAFSAELANRFGVAVDFSIHLPHRSGDDRNHHAHILTTTREVTPVGLGNKASLELSDTDRRKKGLEPSKVEVKAIRERWAVLTNEHLLEQGVVARVDHRSLEAQGIDRVPTTHLGPAVSALERRGIETEVGKRIAWQRAELAQERLERAAELGKIERERAQVVQSILDLSGDLTAARRERGIEKSSAAELLGVRSPKPTLEEIRAAARQGWLQERERQAPEKTSTLEEIRRQGREDWLTLRAEMARGASPAASPSAEKPLPLEPGEPQRPETLQMLTLEQMKAQGRAAIESAQRELQAERSREQQRQAELEKQRELERSKSKGRGRDRGPGRDGPDMER